MVSLGLLFSRHHLIDGGSLKSLTCAFFVGKSLCISLVICFAQRKPIHHVARIMDFEERLQFAIRNGILHTGCEGEVKRLALHRAKVSCYVANLLWQKDRSLVERQFHAASILSETAVIGYQRTHVFCACLHTEHDRTIHDGYVLRHVWHTLNAGVHRH